jgi:hypothetical protein
MNALIFNSNLLKKDFNESETIKNKKIIYVCFVPEIIKKEIKN